MSYSRWITSVWYTFWMNTYDNEKNNQIFCICDIHNFTYKELKENMEKCISTVKETIEGYSGNEEWKNELLCESNIEELKHYMKEFIEDVEQEYPNEGK